ncbi:MAG: hypothetical protein RL497_2479 [Pseudomonadota bacterium]|jgi:thiamine biosynthesis lipoprotein
MGAPCQIRLPATSLGEAEHLAAPLINEVHRFEAKYSRYLPDSLVSCINQAQGTPCVLDAEAAAIIDYAAQLYIQSDGLFDITCGILRQAWDFSRAPGQSEGVIPSPETIQNLMPYLGWHRLDWHNPILTLPEGMQIDLGGLVKEYAADAVAKCALDLGLDCGLVELGGDIRVFGERSWPIGISNPTNPGQSLMQLHLHAGGFATSGNYQRYFLHQGLRYSHILNPKTGWPVVTPAGVSVVGDNCLIAGSISTLALLMGEAHCLEWLYEVGLPFLCVFNDGRVVNEFGV